MNRKIIWFVLLIQIFSISAFAWNSHGHKLIAYIAYSELNSKTRTAMINILKSHPDISKWNEEYKTHDTIPYGAFLFMKASTYPDDIRNSKNPNDHPLWHYIDYKISADGKSEKEIMDPDENILKALNINISIMRNKNSTASDKAVALCWVIHLVGDIHQPLHCSEYFDTDFPEGDKGGNSIWVKTDSLGAPVKLHSYWDALLGKSDNQKEIVDQSSGLIKKYFVKKNSAMTDSVIADWSNESFALAKTVTYMNGQIPQLGGITKKETAPLIPDYKGYNKKCVEVANLKIVMAGYRLQQLMKSFN